METVLRGIGWRHFAETGVVIEIAQQGREQEVSLTNQIANEPLPVNDTAMVPV
jgi:hypothetical protein